VSEIVLRGTLETLWSNSLNISEVLRRRVSDGWPVFQPDEIWAYFTHPELAVRGVCPTCEAYGGREFRGDEVPSEFPCAVFVNPRFIEPCVHERDGLENFFGEPCHCTLEWQNSAECAETRLHAEKLEAVT